MYTMIIGGILGACFCIYMILFSKDGKLAHRILAGLSCFAAVLTVSFMIAGSLTYMLPKVQYEKHRAELHPLGGNSGSLFIEHGVRDQKEFYNMKAKFENDSKIRTVRAYLRPNMDIVEDQSLSDTGSWIEVRQHFDKSHWLGPWTFGNDSVLLSEKILVPAGTAKLR